MVIFFDLDDTLLDHSGAIRSALSSMYREQVIPLSLEALTTKWLEAQRRHYPRYLSGELSYAAVSRLRAREAVCSDLTDSDADDLFGRYLAAYEAAWKLFPDVLPCLDQLSSETLGIISNGPSAEQRRKLRVHLIEDLFQHVLISEECGFPKPDARIFQLACRSASVPAREAVYVGDLFDIDVCGARDAGLRGIWIDRSDRGYGPEDADRLTSLTELPARLRELGV